MAVDDEPARFVACRCGCKAIAKEGVYLRGQLAEPDTRNPQATWNRLMWERQPGRAGCHVLRFPWSVRHIHGHCISALQEGLQIACSANDVAAGDRHRNRGIDRASPVALRFGGGEVVLCDGLCGEQGRVGSACGEG